ncbi:MULTISPECIES: hypothetical protein [Acinetobacter calcoaceticus/baumannii complex]|uniref:hypothetical protein n=1 Tax=Acinetobacter calcoaceticus/baumannii complex TaxID=909768 RepID=UPI000C228262|nr:MULTISPECIES: hypothetical protein [Acinetobacter calcoaceticus/baumannii complex]PJG65539.1 hypothetical protein CVD09_15820 [Acinetobacter seifertii]RIX34709.1 hypothetical protein D3X57_19885 [Acinetobacter baumannii]RIX39221.1 hypothetical protein D3X54_17560 [Acinetobacter baumannii]RJO32790.1 hypothetical protein D3X44_16210 [Acinetobacter baumannii]
MKVVHIKINPNKAILQITWCLLWALVSIALIKRFVPSIEASNLTLWSALLAVLLWFITLILGSYVINSIINRIEKNTKF